MTDYIDRENAVLAIADYLSKTTYTTSISYLNVAAMVLAKVQTADVVEVVKCGDCRFYQDNNGGYPHENCKWNKDETPDEDDYCSCGERRIYD